MKRLGDGGPAFPVFSKGGGDADFGGMRMRDYFAAHAPKFDRFFQEPDDKYLARVVDWNCKYADAMIAKLKAERS